MLHQQALDIASCCVRGQCAGIGAALGRGLLADQPLLLDIGQVGVGTKVTPNARSFELALSLVRRQSFVVAKCVLESVEYSIEVSGIAV